MVTTRVTERQVIEFVAVQSRKPWTGVWGREEIGWGRVGADTPCDFRAQCHPGKHMDKEMEETIGTQVWKERAGGTLRPLRLELQCVWWGCWLCPPYPGCCAQ